GLGIAATPGQIVLTQGAAQALDLVIRHLLAPGDCVLVDDPGYYNLFGQLRLHGVTLLGVPRHADGPDLAALEALLSAHRPRAFFLQSGLHNPSGGGLAPHIAFRLLALAERHDFLLVEDDSFADFQGQPGQRLATLDQLQRVLYIGGFSKPLSASLRVGFLAATPPLARELADLKLLTALAGSEGVERVVHGLLTEGYYRKHLERLRARLRQAREATLHRFRALGVELFHEPQDGMFLWARLPGVEDATALAAAAEREGVLLAPGQAFRPGQQPSPWLRFNVAWCQDLRLWRCLARLREAAGG
ncbi:MAG TPA: PLP-dependent aminotransferase family protein, partial [Candidatus Competibacteraceae bacterium]|nr:PLP-dependent aminotransferase family protein [Candidatus Competibacteraceae bacterium]